MKLRFGFKPGAGANAPKHCSLCFKAGHNRATCPVMLKADKRRALRVRSGLRAGFIASNHTRVLLR